MLEMLPDKVILDHPVVVNFIIIFPASSSFILKLCNHVGGLGGGLEQSELSQKISFILDTALVTKEWADTVLNLLSEVLMINIISISEKSLDHVKVILLTSSVTVQSNSAQRKKSYLIMASLLISKFLKTSSITTLETCLGRLLSSLNNSSIQNMWTFRPSESSDSTRFLRTLLMKVFSSDNLLSFFLMERPDIM